MSGLGIAAVGAYAPRARIDAGAFESAWGRYRGPGIERKAVPAVDEDTLTMAYEAASHALASTNVSAEDVTGLSFASTTPPLAEESVTARLGSMLGLPSDAVHETRTDTTATGASALVDALRDRSDGTRLVVASDAPRGHPDSAVEHAGGAGAAAFLLTPDGPGRLEARADYTYPSPGTRFREPGTEAVESLGITPYERQAFIETVAGAVERLEYDPDDLDGVAVQSPNATLPRRVAGVIGVSPELVGTPGLVRDLGDTGAASVPLELAGLFERGAARVLAVGFGSGATATAMVLAGTPPVSTSFDAGEDLSYPAYLRRRGDLTSGAPEGGGAYVSVPAWRRTVAQRYRLVAGACSACGALNFPPDGACLRCHAVASYEPVSLSRTGTVEAVSVVAQGGAPSEFAEQQSRSGAYATAIVGLDGGGDESASVPAFVVDADPEAVRVGDAVTATIRRIYTQEGVTRYGVKFRPATQERTR